MEIVSLKQLPLEGALSRFLYTGNNEKLNSWTKMLIDYGANIDYSDKVSTTLNKHILNKYRLVKSYEHND